MINDEIKKDLFDVQDTDFKEFNSNLIPTVDKSSVIGVRTPMLKKLAKKYVVREDLDGFLSELPHEYFDENQLHAYILSEIKDFQLCIGRINLFIPFIDNWATCDSLSPKVFKKHRSELLPLIEEWLSSDDTYTVRFAIGTLMRHFLGEDFSVEYLDMVVSVESDEYYINMMRAWYFATALAKQYEAAITVIEDNRLDIWTHNKTIQKAVESYRISSDQKTYLKTLKRKPA